MRSFTRCNRRIDGADTDEMIDTGEAYQYIIDAFIEIEAKMYQETLEKLGIFLAF
ncbi:hypothetical protein [Lentibacillus salinarum]|uniref:Uncharacterized protein n=1 Tax=Lentibacillus salinarum TaxID=446820 RepID=A0ABW3ZTV6_9BACI